MTIYKFVILIFLCTIKLSAEFSDYGTLILGRPTSSSISANVLAKKTLQFYLEYGIQSGNYQYKTENYSSAFPEPVEFKIINLEPNTKYYYRIQFREEEQGNYLPSNEYFFHTQRSKSSSFMFTIQSDSHLYDKKGINSVMEITLKNQIKDSADFIFDLGDTFGDDHEPFTITNEEVKQLHLDLLPFFGMLCHSSPLFLCLGNHEGESGYYLLQTPPNNLATYATKWRTKYYPNPFPDGFYTGNEDIEPDGIGKPQNYYSFEWGDALFVILDVYRYYTANEKPQKWDWTLGDKQYFWLKNTLETSNAKYKFVFAHHTLGQGRGAATTAMLYEWGGYDDQGKTKYTFDKNRPGWGKPIHQLMKDNGVQVFFQGHDHLFAKEDVDGIVYQELPMPSDSTYQIGMLANADAYTGVSLDGSGYLRVTVSENDAKVDYVKSYLSKDENDTLKNGMVGYSYSVKPKTTLVDDSKNSASEMEVYPNPASDYIYISGNESRYEIINLLGIKILEGDNISNKMIDISKLDKGIYFVRLNEKVLKIIKY